MRRRRPTDEPAAEDFELDANADTEQPTVPFERGYLTDGRGLFHVERTLVDRTHSELLVELEDCATLELIVCSVRSLAHLSMRPVQPLGQISR